MAGAPGINLCKEEFSSNASVSTVIITELNAAKGRHLASMLITLFVPRADVSSAMKRAAREAGCLEFEFWEC
jgi:hypothetical protein